MAVGGRGGGEVLVEEEEEGFYALGWGLDFQLFVKKVGMEVRRVRGLVWCGYVPLRWRQCRRGWWDGCLGEGGRWLGL